MTIQPDKYDLESITVDLPCDVSWDSLEGEDRSRYCNKCDLNVFNLSKYSEEEIQELMASSDGSRMCAWVVKNKSGKLKVDNCPNQLKPAIEKLFKLLTIVGLTAFLTAQANAGYTQSGGGISCTTTNSSSSFQTPIFTAWLASLPIGGWISYKTNKGKLDKNFIVKILLAMITVPFLYHVGAVIVVWIVGYYPEWLLSLTK